MRQKQFADCRGFSLIEISIVLAIAGLVVAGIWMLMTTVNQNAREARLAAQVTETMANARRVLGKGSEVNAPGDFTDDAIAAGIFPNDMVRNATTAIHALGGNATLTFVGGVAPVLRLTLAGMQSESCVDIVTKVVSSVATRQQYGITGLRVSVAGLGPNVISNADVPVATLVSACSPGGAGVAGVNVALEFTFL